MAIFHLHVQNGSRNGGQSAVAKSLYITRRDRFESRGDLAASGCGNLPAWARDDALFFWGAADEFSRANARLFTEVEAALPNGLTREQQKELVRGYLDDIARRDGGVIPFEWAIHDSGKSNPHVHIQLSPRVEDGLERDIKTWFSRAATGSKKTAAEGGARSWASLPKNEWTAWVNDVREAWATHANETLARAGSSERIDHRSNKERGLDAVPTTHQGYEHISQESPASLARNTRRAEVQQRNELIKELNKEHAELKAREQILRRQIDQEKRDAEAVQIVAAQDPETVRQQRIANTLHVPLDQVEATLRLITPPSPEARASMPGLAGGRAFANPGSIHHLRPRFVSKSIANDQVQLHLRMPDDALVFVERSSSIRIRDGYDRETVAAALQVGASKWETMVLTGPPEFKRMALQEARRLGILDRVEIPSEFEKEFRKSPEQEAAASKVLQPTAGDLPAKGTAMSNDKDKLDFLNVQPASGRPAATASDPIPDPTLSEFEIAKRELELELQKLTFAQLLDLKSDSATDFDLTAEMLERLVALFLRLASLGLFKLDQKISAAISARQHLAKMAAKEIEMRREASADAATQRAVFDAHTKAVRERVVALERRESLASSPMVMYQAAAAATKAAGVLRRQWREGFDRLQVSRKQATISDREADVLSAKKKVALIEATAVPPVGLFGGKAKQEAHDVAAAKKAERLGRAERVRDAAQASLDAGWSEIDDKLAQNRAAAAAVKKAAQKVRDDELTEMRAQIEASPKEAATIGRAVDRERIAEVRDRAIADAAKPVTDEEVAAAAERLRIRRLVDGRTPR